MMCGRVKELIATSWKDPLEPAEQSELDRHLHACTECSGEVAQLTAIWERLADLPAPEPGPQLRARWQETFRSLAPQASPASIWHRWKWPVAIPAACVIAGIAIGLAVPRGAADRGEIARLRSEMAAAQELVTLSLLQQSSATARLRGVDYSASIQTPDPQITAALVQAAKSDASVNVRLAAIDALTKLSDNTQVRESLTRSLNEQESPMVQAALINYVVDAKDGHDAELIEHLAARPDLNPAIRQLAGRAIERLAGYR